LRRVNVKGTSGSGKTTFARELARRLDLPFVELDALHHGPDWYQPTAEEFRARVLEAMAQLPNGWVIDGNYEAKLGDIVIGAADTIVWLDLPLALKLRRVGAGRARGSATTSSSGTETRRPGAPRSGVVTHSSPG